MNICINLCISCHQHTSPPLSSTKRRSTTILCVCNMSSTHCMKNIISSFIIMQFCQKIQQVLHHAQNIQAIKFQICKFYSIQDSTFRTCKLAIQRCSRKQLLLLEICKFVKFCQMCKLAFLPLKIGKIAHLLLLRQQLFASLQTTSQQFFLRYTSQQKLRKQMQDNFLVQAHDYCFLL